MHKRLLASSLLTGLALVTFHQPSSGGPPEPEAVCYQMTYASATSPRPVDLTYSTQQGVLLRFYQDNRVVTARVPLETGGDPNPHFDRMYALLMKGIDSQRIEQVCVDRAPDSGVDPVELVSVTVQHVEPPKPLPPPDVQRVQVCDRFTGTRCASVTNGRLEVLPPQ